MLVSISRNKFTEIRNTTTKQLKKIRGIISMMLREQKKKLNSLLYLLYEAPKLALTSEVQQLPSKISRL